MKETVLDHSPTPPTPSANPSRLRPRDKRLIWDKAFGQSSLRFTVHYNGSSVPRLTWLYICWGFMKCGLGEWCELGAHGWCTHTHARTHLGRWWNDERRCTIFLTHKKCLLIHTLAIRWWRATVSFVNQHLHTQTQDIMIMPVWLDILWQEKV